MLKVDFRQIMLKETNNNGRNQENSQRITF